VSRHSSVLEHVWWRSVARDSVLSLAVLLRLRLGDYGRVGAELRPEVEGVIKGIPGLLILRTTVAVGDGGRPV